MVHAHVAITQHQPHSQNLSSLVRRRSSFCLPPKNTFSFLALKKHQSCVHPPTNSIFIPIHVYLILFPSTCTSLFWTCIIAVMSPLAPIERGKMGPLKGLSLPTYAPCGYLATNCLLLVYILVTLLLFV